MKIIGLLATIVGLMALSEMAIAQNMTQNITPPGRWLLKPSARVQPPSGRVSRQQIGERRMVIQSMDRAHKGLQQSMIAGALAGTLASFITTWATDNRPVHLFVGALAGMAITIPIQKRAERPPTRFIMAGALAGGIAGLGVSFTFDGKAPFIGVSASPPLPPPAP